MWDAFFFVVILIMVTVFAVNEAKKAMRKKTGSAGRPAGTVPSTQDANAASPAPASPAPAASPAAAAPLRHASLADYTSRFVSLEGRADETDWHDAVMTGEGTDPCHDEMYPAPSVEHFNPKHAEKTEEAREWAKAVVMAEILKRPAERRWNARGRS